jgi:hypothetical protein
MNSKSSQQSQTFIIPIVFSGIEILIQFIQNIEHFKRLEMPFKNEIGCMLYSLQLPKPVGVMFNTRR